MVDAVVGAVEVVDVAVVEGLALVAVLEWLTVDVGRVVGDPPQETRPRVKAASAVIVALRRIIPHLYQVLWRSLSDRRVPRRHLAELAVGQHRWVTGHRSVIGTQPPRLRAALVQLR